MNTGTGARERAYPHRHGAELPRLAPAHPLRGAYVMQEQASHGTTVSSQASRLSKGEQ